MGKLLTVGMAVHQDWRVWSTVTGLLWMHHEARRDFEILVVDNAPESDAGKWCRRWINGKKIGRYVEFPEPKGTAQPRQQVFEQAQTPYVLCCDPHVLFWPGAIARLIAYFREHPDTSDLLMGPLATENVTDEGRVGFMGTHQRPKWGGGSWGVWSQDDDLKPLDNPPKEIWQQGMGVFACRREAWVGFHPDMRGFGGCESYVMHKFRARGDRVLCLPFLRWVHDFSQPGGRTYAATMEDKLRNYLLGWTELGREDLIDETVEHFAMGRKKALRLIEDATTISTGPPEISQNAPDLCLIEPELLQNGPEVFQIGPPDLSKSMAVVGAAHYGGVKMRGRALAQHFGCKLATPQQVEGMRRREVIVVVKGPLTPAARQQCDRLIWDPLDAFYASPRAEPVEWFRRMYRAVPFDEVIATSPACMDVIREALPDVPIHLVPHQCDPAPQPDWRNPDGPVAYSGQECFIESRSYDIQEACRRVGREFVRGLSVGVLRGASVALALRCPPYGTPLNRFCKPQIKTENAAAAGLPVIATDDPCVTSLRPECVTVPADFTVEQLVEALRVEAEPLTDPYTEAKFLADMEAILCGVAIQ